MSHFKDKKGSEWKVELDAPTIQEIEARHGIKLTDLESADPLLKMRNDPMTLVAVIHLICEEQITARNLGPVEFAKLLPSADVMLTCVREALVSFFPSGRASHIEEVLTKYEEMTTKTDQLFVTKMAKMINDPKTMEVLGSKADEMMASLMSDIANDEDFGKKMREMYPLNFVPGTAPTTANA